MGLLIVNDKEWEDSLKDCGVGGGNGDNQDHDHNGRTITHDEIPKGRGEGKTEVPQGIREIIAEEKIAGTTGKELAKIFGVSESSVSAYAAGATSTASYREKNEGLLRARNRVYKKASNRLISALNALGDKDLTELKAKDISSIAKDMSVIVEKVGPREASNHEESSKQVHLHIWSPKMKEVSDYEIVEVNNVEE